MKRLLLSMAAFCFVLPVAGQEPVRPKGPASEALPSLETLPGIAEPASACCEPPCPRWQFRFIPYGWLPGFHGDVTVRGVTAPVDVSIGEVADIVINELNFLFMGQFEATNGKWGTIFNGIYVDVQPGAQIRRLDLGTDLRILILDWTATYKLEGLEQRLPAGSEVLLLAGARYYSLSADITVTGPLGNSVSASGTQDWLDPIVGFRARVPLTCKITGQLRADIGGFGIDGSSRFSWNVEATAEYRCTERLSLVAGWRWLDVDFQSGSGANRFAFDMHMSGPIVGFAFSF